MGNKQNKTVKPDFKELSKNIGLSTSEVGSNKIFMKRISENGQF